MSRARNYTDGLHIRLKEDRSYAGKYLAACADDSLDAFLVGLGDVIDVYPLQQISALQQEIVRLTAERGTMLDQRDTARNEYERLELRHEKLKRHIDAIAEALHPHKPKDGGWTYLPDQLAEMVTTLKRENDDLKKRSGIP